jgi:hypothetical protein
MGAYCCFSKSILLFFARAGLLTLYLFFFNINRVIGLLVLYNTVLENSYDNIL